MKKPFWPLILIITGFGLMTACIMLILTAHLGDKAHILALVGESFGVGLGSIGIGMFIATRQR